jgi:hypothetical protein
MQNTCTVDGYPYTDHPPADPPPARYLRVRSAFRRAIAEVIYWPGISEAHRLAIVRARQDRQAVSR